MAEELPLFPLNTVLFPTMVLPLHIFEERYRLMLSRRLDEDPMFGVILTRMGREVGDQPEIHLVGTAASLLEAVRHGDGRYHIAVRGGQRFRVLDAHWAEGYLTGVVEWLDRDDAVPATDELLRLDQAVRQAFMDYLDVLERAADVQIERADLGEDPIAASYAICSMMPFNLKQRQRLLEIVEPVGRLLELLDVLHRERTLLLRTGIGGAAMDQPALRFSAN